MAANRSCADESGPALRRLDRRAPDAEQTDHRDRECDHHARRSRSAATSRGQNTSAPSIDAGDVITSPNTSSSDHPTSAHTDEHGDPPTQPAARRDRARSPTPRATAAPPVTIPATIHPATSGCSCSGSAARRGARPAHHRPSRPSRPRAPAGTRTRASRPRGPPARAARGSRRPARARAARPARPIAGPSAIATAMTSPIDRGTVVPKSATVPRPSDRSPTIAAAVNSVPSETIAAM